MYRHCFGALTFESRMSQWAQIRLRFHAKQLLIQFIQKKKIAHQIRTFVLRTYIQSHNSTTFGIMMTEVMVFLFSMSFYSFNRRHLYSFDFVCFAETHYLSAKFGSFWQKERRRKRKQ